MGEECRDCLQVKNIEERLKKCEEMIGNKGDGFENRITALERRVDVSDEKFKQVFEKLDTIITILEKREERLPSLVWSVGGMVFGGVMSGVIMWLVTK